MRLLSVLTPIFLAASIFTTQGLVRGEVSSVSKVYRCDRRSRVPVVYLKTAAGESFATMYFRGKLVQMRAYGSGETKYASLDEQLGYRWKLRGNVATLSFLAADHTATEKPILRKCLAILK